LTDGTATLSSGALSGATTINASGAITGGSLTDGTATLSSGALSGATTVTASGAVTGGSLTDGTATLSSGALSGATDIDGSGDLTMGTVTMTGFSVDASGNIDLDANLDMDGTTATFDASSAISLDAGAASNFTTTAGDLTLEGAGGVTVTSTGGTMALNGAGQTVDFNAGLLDLDASLGIDVDVPSGQDLFLTGGQIHLISNEDVYRGIYLKTNAGTSETIDLRNVKGTGAQAIQLKSLVGSIDVDAGVNLTMDADNSISLDAAAASNFTTSAGELTLDGAGGVNVAGNAAEVDVTTTGAVDVNGAEITLDASSGLSLDAAAASNFTTSAGALTLDGAGGVNISGNTAEVDVTTTDTVDLNAGTLDVDATTITIDATTTTFTGNVEGPNATADNQFTTYYQLDSLANRAPFNETLRRFRLGTSQSITTGAGSTRVALSGSGIYTESSDPVENPVDPLNPPMSVQSTGGQHIDLSDPGIYQVMLTMELSNSNVSDALALVEIYNFDALQTVFPTLRVLASDTEEVYGTGNAFTGVNSHLNLSMTFEADNSNEDIYIQITTYGANIDIEGYGFTVSRIGEQ